MTSPNRDILELAQAIEALAEGLSMAGGHTSSDEYIGGKATDASAIASEVADRQFNLGLLEATRELQAWATDAFGPEGAEIPSGHPIMRARYAIDSEVYRRRQAGTLMGVTDQIDGNPVTDIDLYPIGGVTQAVNAMVRARNAIKGSGGEIGEDNRYNDLPAAVAALEAALGRLNVEGFSDD